MARILRLLGWTFIALAIASFAFDLFSFSQKDTFQFSLLGENWFALHAGSLNLLQAVTERYISPVVWDSALSPLLFFPTLAIFAFLAVFFLLLSKLPPLNRA